MTLAEYLKGKFCTTKNSTAVEVSRLLQATKLEWRWMAQVFHETGKSPQLIPGAYKAKVCKKTESLFKDKGQEKLMLRELTKGESAPESELEINTESLEEGPYSILKLKVEDKMLRDKLAARENDSDSSAHKRAARMNLKRKLQL